MFNNVHTVLEVHVQKFFPIGYYWKVWLNHMMMPEYLHSARALHYRAEAVSQY